MINSELLKYTNPEVVVFNKKPVRVVITYRLIYLSTVQEAGSDAIIVWELVRAVQLGQPRLVSNFVDRDIIRVNEPGVWVSMEPFQHRT